MKILFICEAPPARLAPGGGAAYHWQNLAALHELGHELHLASSAGPSELEPEVAARVTSAHPVRPRPPRPGEGAFWLARLFRSETLPFRIGDWQRLRPQLERLVERLAPDLLWVEHILMLAVAPRGLPIVYSHTDFLHRLMPLRRAARGPRLRRPDLLSAARVRERELDLCRGVGAALTASPVDGGTLEGLGVATAYVPIVGPPVEPPAGIPRPVPRAFLFGRFNTAMRLTLRELRERVWPHFERLAPEVELHQVGQPPASPGAGWRWLERRFTVHGFVPELGEVMAPGDLCLVPYPSDTGFRVKFVTAAAHGLINVGYERTFRCAPEFESGVDCLMAPDPASFAEAVARCAADEALRRRLARGARELYERSYTLASHLPAYERLLTSALAAGRRRTAQ